jgi:hypothetical protein
MQVGRLFGGVNCCESEQNQRAEMRGDRGFGSIIFIVVGLGCAGPTEWY